MNESMLISFLKLIAGISFFKKEENLKLLRKNIETYIERNYGKGVTKEKLNEFDKTLSELSNHTNKTAFIEKVCHNINKEFLIRQKILLVINVLNFFSHSESGSFNYGSDEGSILAQILGWLKISQNEYLNLKYFATNQLYHIPQKGNLLIVSKSNPNLSEIRFLKSDGLNGFLIFLYLPSAEILLVNYTGKTLMEVNGKPLYPKHTYVFSSGSLITSKETSPIYYGQVIKSILETSISNEITLNANNISYKYGKSKKGVANLSFYATSGELIGIMGGSGVGKSTLLKLLSGSLKAQKGEVLINGNNINKIRANLSGTIGVMHQEECLVEELTVFENLYFTARLAIGNKPHSYINEMVENKLHELDLADCIHNKVGSPGNRELSGGQRKRLAIAMEVIREPKILFVDEPTSGLSSADADGVMNILKSIALSGKLVIVNIHQPSSEVFKLFDSVIIVDKGGVPIFQGNPIESIFYFKAAANKVDKFKGGCECCGNLKPELIFDIVEERTVDEIGQKTSERKLTPEDWHQQFLQKKAISISTSKAQPIPEAKYSKLGLFQQFAVFFNRNLLAKLRNFEFILLALLLPPVLAVIISGFLRYSTLVDNSTEDYNFFSNPNLAPFFLICILASLFFGLILSCADIIRDNQIIKREQFIGLSLRSYYNSKIAFLITLSLYQTLTFALLGGVIIGLKGITFHFWFILFSVSLFGNLLGLIISSTLKSVVAIYIIVPFLIIPQILFSGLVVRFDNLNSKIGSQNLVPWVGEAMITRWAVESIIVDYYKNNNFNKYFFDYDFKESVLRFRLLHLLPDMQNEINNLLRDTTKITESKLQLIKNGTALLAQYPKAPPVEAIHITPPTLFLVRTEKYIERVKKSISNQYSAVKFDKDKQIERRYSAANLASSLQLTKNKYFNKYIDDFVRNRYVSQPFVRVNNAYIQKIDPIFYVSNSKYGRSHFMASYKRFGNTLIETFWFNVLAIWLMIFTSYLLFVFNFFPALFRKVVFFTKKRLD